MLTPAEGFAVANAGGGVLGILIRLIRGWFASAREKREAQKQKEERRFYERMVWLKSLRPDVDLAGILQAARPPDPDARHKRDKNGTKKLIVWIWSKAFGIEFGSTSYDSSYSNKGFVLQYLICSIATTVCIISLYWMIAPDQLITLANEKGLPAIEIGLPNIIPLIGGKIISIPLWWADKAPVVSTKSIGIRMAQMLNFILVCFLVQRGGGR